MDWTYQKLLVYNTKYIDNNNNKNKTNKFDFVSKKLSTV